MEEMSIQTDAGLQKALTRFFKWILHNLAVKQNEFFVYFYLSENGMKFHNIVINLKKMIK